MADSPQAKSDGLVGISLMIDGKEIDETIEVASIRIIKEIGRIPKATVVFLDGDVASQEFPIADDKTMNPGAEIEIKAGYGEYSFETVFKGVITAQRLRIRSGSSPNQLELTCRDKVISAHVVRKMTYFEKKKDSEILSSLFAATEVTTNVTTTTDEARNQVQYDCTDWDFARILSERNGYVLIADDGAISIGKPELGAALLTITLGDDLIEYDVETDALDQLDGATTTTWDTARLVIDETTGSAFTGPKIGDLTASSLAAAVKNPVLSMVLPASVDFAGKAPADARLQRAELARIRGTVLYSGSAKVKPGTMIELVGVSKAFSGDGFVSAVQHVISDGSWTTEAKLGLDPEWRSDATGLAGAAAAGLTAPVQGLQIGIVTKLTESPDGEPKIEVSLPFLGENTKLWARYAAPYAGNQIGFMMVPEITDEVIVGFLSQHPDHPVILGSLHSAKNARPDPVEEQNNIKTFVSRAGLKMSFNEDTKSILLETPKGHMVFIDDDQDAITLQDTHSGKIQMDSTGILLESDTDITLSAKGKINLEAAGDCTISGMNVSASADAGFSASGGSSAEVTAGGTLKVQGGLVQIN